MGWLCILILFQVSLPCTDSPPPWQRKAVNNVTVHWKDHLYSYKDGNGVIHTNCLACRGNTFVGELCRKDVNKETLCTECPVGSWQPVGYSTSGYHLRDSCNCTSKACYWNDTVKNCMKCPNPCNGSCYLEDCSSRGDMVESRCLCCAEERKPNSNNRMCQIIEVLTQPDTPWTGNKTDDSINYCGNAHAGRASTASNWNRTSPPDLDLNTSATPTHEGTQPSNERGKDSTPSRENRPISLIVLLVVLIGLLLVAAVCVVYCCKRHGNERNVAQNYSYRPPKNEQNDDSPGSQEDTDSEA